MRICVIFNPTAKGDRARHFRRRLDLVAGECALKQTVAPGGARPLAAEAVREGFDTIVAAGGDGTLNEVLNGIGDEPGGFERARLGVLPVGTVNVFAKELGMPLPLAKAWQVIRAGRETLIDLPSVQYSPFSSSTRTDDPGGNSFKAAESTGSLQPVSPSPGGEGGTAIHNPQTAKQHRHYFAQMAGAGLDARAIQLVDWELKKKIGPFAYVWASILALRGPPAQITATNGTESAAGELVLIGNGCFYGGRYRVFHQADRCDGLLEVRVFPRANWLTVARCAGVFLAGQPLPGAVAKRFRAGTFTLASSSPAPLEVDGEIVGNLPATFSIERQKLRVIVP
jgi:diacylglycerol kinase family enzyme